jgi:hypothetical protein
MVATMVAVAATAVLISIRIKPPHGHERKT